jgi:hypothetical protein
MTTADIMLLVLSTVVIGGLYLVGRYAKNAQRNGTADKTKR